MNDLSTAFAAEQLSDEVIAEISQLLEKTTSTSEKGELFKRMSENNLDQKRFLAPRKLETEKVKKMEEPIFNFPPVRRKASSRVLQEAVFSKVCEFCRQYFSPGSSGKTLCESCYFAKLPAEQVNLSSAETNMGNKSIATRKLNPETMKFKIP